MWALTIDCAVTDIEERIPTLPLPYCLTLEKCYHTCLQCMFAAYVWSMVAALPLGSQESKERTGDFQEPGLCW